MDENQPATKGDIANLDRRLNRLEHRLGEVTEEVKRHFEVVVEQLRHDLLGAKHDEVEVLKDKSQEHERRITRLERVSGLTVA